MWRNKGDPGRPSVAVKSLDAARTIQRSMRFLKKKRALHRAEAKRLNRVAKKKKAFGMFPGAGSGGKTAFKRRRLSDPMNKFANLFAMNSENTDDILVGYVVRLQRVYRRRYAQITTAATRLQCVHRGRLARRWQSKKIAAACTIQRASRVKQSVKKVEARREERRIENKAAITIQQAARIKRSRAAVQRRRQWLRAQAAMRIQALGRGRAARLEFRIVMAGIKRVRKLVLRSRVFTKMIVEFQKRKAQAQLVLAARAARGHTEHAAELRAKLHRATKVLEASMRGGLGDAVVSEMQFRREYVQRQREALAELGRRATEGLLNADEQQLNVGDYYSEENLMARRNIEHHVELHEATNKFFRLVVQSDHNAVQDAVLEKGGLHRVWLEFSQYEKLMNKIVLTMVPADVFDAAEFGKTIREEWEKDSHGKGHMTVDDLHVALFELADTWCEHIAAEEYVEFLDFILRGITYKASQVAFQGGSTVADNAHKWVFRDNDDIEYLDVVSYCNADNGKKRQLLRDAERKRRDHARMAKRREMLLKKEMQATSRGFSKNDWEEGGSEDDDEDDDEEGKGKRRRRRRGAGATTSNRMSKKKAERLRKKTERLRQQEMRRAENAEKVKQERRRRQKSMWDIQAQSDAAFGIGGPGQFSSSVGGGPRRLQPLQALDVGQVDIDLQQVSAAAALNKFDPKGSIGAAIEATQAVQASSSTSTSSTSSLLSSSSSSPAGHRGVAARRLNAHRRLEQLKRRRKLRVTSRAGMQVLRANGTQESVLGPVTKSAPQPHSDPAKGSAIDWVLHHLKHQRQFGQLPRVGPFRNERHLLHVETSAPHKHFRAGGDQVLPLRTAKFAERVTTPRLAVGRVTMDSWRASRKRWQHIRRAARISEQRRALRRAIEAGPEGEPDKLLADLPEPVRIIHVAGPECRSDADVTMAARSTAGGKWSVPGTGGDVGLGGPITMDGRAAFPSPRPQKSQAAVLEAIHGNGAGSDDDSSAVSSSSSEEDSDSEDGEDSKRATHHFFG